MKNEDIGVKVSGQHINNLRFTDDIDQIAESQEEGLQYLTDKANKSSNRLGLKINTKNKQKRSQSERTT